jgi:hypothetical protein
VVGKEKEGIMSRQKESGEDKHSLKLSNNHSNLVDKPFYLEVSNPYFFKKFPPQKTIET